MSSKNHDVNGEKLPPHQVAIKRLLRWGIDHPGIMRVIPKIDLKSWMLVVDGEVENPLRLGWGDVLKFPRVESVSDFHCVEGWSVLGCKWEGIRFKYLVDVVKPKESAKFVMFECADGYTTSLSLKELSGDNVLLAYKLDGKELEEGLGFPLRLVVPDKYAYKSAMWVTRITFMSRKEVGYWEKRGYSDTADVWKNDRFVSGLVNMKLVRVNSQGVKNIHQTKNGAGE
jgi:DMSO/TMAO reductase YedYZ molybdopterin-dependent catalytic subunit